MTPNLVNILLVDRTGRFAPALQRTLLAAEYRVAGVSTEQAARQRMAAEPFNIVIKSFETAESDGVPLMEKLRELSPDTEFILVSEGGSIRTAIDAIHHGAFDHLSWPVDNEHILRSVRQALEHQALVAADPGIRGRLRRKKEVDIFAGSNPLMNEVQQILRRVAPSDVTVLIEGESGTGKEIAARALHEKSPRREGPFVAVNCAALPDTLIESEFFGHVRGAFTGAIADKPGRFELARGGTLFLDEIGDLSPLGQADLLRVLEDGVFRPIGSRTVQRANVRIVAATNRNLEERCAEGRFREDLFYRLNVITLVLPPLRERAEDIPHLLETFSRHFAARHKRPPKRFSPAAVRLLCACGWPGNVRQLRNLVERLALTAPAHRIEPEHLPAKIRGERPANGLAAVSVGMTLAEAEAELIRQTLVRAGNRRTEAARMLGISRRTLHYKLGRLGGGVNPEPPRELSEK
ncbi:MAG TPA: sigma-54 dependent transcriptional regulator [Chthoniobacterales bacterium]